MHHDRLRVIDCDVSAAYCWSSSGDGVNLLCETVISALQTSRMIGGFWSILIACCVALLRASTLLGILISLSLLTSLGWSLRWMASFTLREYQLGSWSVNLTFSERGCTQSYFRNSWRLFSWKSYFPIMLSKCMPCCCRQRRRSSKHLFASKQLWWGVLLNLLCTNVSRKRTVLSLLVSFVKKTVGCWALGCCRK